MKIFGIKTCDSCRKAMKALREKGDEVTFVDLRATPLESADLERFWAAFGEDLLNRRSTTWRALAQSERDQSPQVLLRVHPTLMKRPVIDTGEALYLGWWPQTRAALLGAAG